MFILYRTGPEALLPSGRRACYGGNAYFQADAENTFNILALPQIAFL